MPLSLDILGAGSVGLALAGRLADLPDAAVRLLTRTPQQAARLNAEGFVLYDERGQRRVKVAASGGREPSDYSADVLLVAVKCPDTVAAARQHAAAVGPNTLVVTIQNGLGADAILRAAFGDRVAVAVTRMGAHRTDDGVRLVSPGRTLVGPAAEALTPARDRLVAALNAAGFPAEPTGDIAGHVWRKLLINAAINAPATLRGCRNGELLGDADSESVMRDVIGEGMTVAAAEGIAPFANAAEAEAEVHAVAHATADNINSMLADVRAGRETEIDFINGAFVRLGEKHGVPTPVNRNLVRLVKALGERGEGRGVRG